MRSALGRREGAIARRFMMEDSSEIALVYGLPAAIADIEVRRLIGRVSRDAVAAPIGDADV
jgi:hypothetical protein